MEGQAAWHGAAPNDEQYAQAISELDAYIENQMCIRDSSRRLYSYA